jgi:hypothetical protein
MSNEVTLTCMVCNKEFEGEEPKMCCSGRDCGCMGMPIDPIVCSEECYDNLPFNKSKTISTMSNNINFWEGCIVKRNKVWADYFNDHRTGVVVKDFGERCKIKWDEKASTGQQHSTISKKNLVKL